MQKTSKKASILIWSIFLSIIISTTFIWISIKINQNLNENNELQKEIQTKNNIKNIINKKEYINTTLDNWEKIIFDSKRDINIWLKKDENILVKIDENIIINIINWWPVFYSIWTSSWIVNNNSEINTSWNINIKNLWWYTKLQLTSNKDLVTKYQKYKIVKTIWNKEVIKTTWKIKNF